MGSWAFFHDIGESTIPTSLPTTDWCAPEVLASPSEGSGSPASPWDSMARIGLGLQDISANKSFHLEEATKAVSESDDLLVGPTEDARNGHLWEVPYLESGDTRKPL